MKGFWGLFKAIWISFFILGIIHIFFYSDIINFFEIESIEDAKDFIGIIYFLLSMPIFAIILFAYSIKDLKVITNKNKNRKKNVNVMSQEIRQERTEEFENICEKLEVENIPYLLEIFNVSIKKLKVALIFLAMGFGSIFLQKCGFFKIKYEFLFFIFCITIIYIGLRILLQFSSYYKKLEIECKKRVFPKYIKLINDRYTYTPFKDREKNQKFFKRFEESITDIKGEYMFSSEDYIEGYINNDIFVEMADLDVRQSYGKEKFSIFTGIFAYVKYSENMQGRIKICKNRFEESILEFDRLKKVKMDNPLFEEYFDVFADNDIFAMKFLTHKIMEDLIEFVQKYNIDLEIEVKNNELFFRFYTGNIFKASIKKDGLNKNSLYKYYVIIKLIEETILKIDSIVKEM